MDRLRVVYTDVDGTLVSDGCLFRKRGGVTLAKAEAIYRLLRAGVDVVMVSGRDHRRLAGTARLLGFTNYIGNLGLEVVYGRGDRIVHAYGVDIGEAADLEEWIGSTGAPDELLDRYEGRLFPYRPWNDMLHTHYLLVGEIDAREADDWLAERHPSLRLVDNGAVAPHAGLEAPHAFHLLPRDAGKREAVARDMTERDLATRQVVAVGDSTEDLRMASEVGLYFSLAGYLRTDRGNVVRVDNDDENGFPRIIDTLAAADVLG